jgi:hypothetical protein
LIPGREAAAVVLPSGKGIGIEAESGRRVWEGDLGEGSFNAVLQDPKTGRGAAFFSPKGGYKTFDPDRGPDEGDLHSFEGKPYAAGGDRIFLLRRGDGSTTFRVQSLSTGEVRWEASFPGLYEEALIAPGEGMAVCLPASPPAMPYPVLGVALSTGVCQWAVSISRRPVEAALCGDGLLLRDGVTTIAQYGLETGKLMWKSGVLGMGPRRMLAAHSVFAVAIGTSEGTVTLFDRKSGGNLGRYPLRLGVLTELAFHGSGGLWVGGERGKVLLGVPEAPGEFLPLLDRTSPKRNPFLLPRLFARGDRVWEGIERLSAEVWAGKSVEVKTGALDHLNLVSAVEGAAFAKTRILRARRFAHPPQMDGDLTEPWSEADALPLTVESLRFFPEGKGEARWGGDADLSAVIYTGWDHEAFYLAIDFRDDRPRMPYDAGAREWTGDIVFFALDRLGNGGFEQDPKDDDVVWMFWPKRDAARPPPPRRRDEGAKRRGVKPKPGGEGMDIEIAFPWEEKFNNHLRRWGLRGRQIRPRPGVRFGFNLILLDDDGEGPDQYLALAPGLSLKKSRARSFRDGFWPQLWVQVELR